MPEPLACQIKLNGTTVRVPTRRQKGLHLAARHHRRGRRGQKVLIAIKSMDRTALGLASPSQPALDGIVEDGT
jgi:hypothetical protein